MNNTRLLSVMKSMSFDPHERLRARKRFIVHELNDILTENAPLVAVVHEHQEELEANDALHKK